MSICSFKILIEILLSESFERRNLSKKYYIYRVFETDY